MRFLDFIFCRMFVLFRSQKFDVEDVREKCCNNLVKMLHVIIFPIAFNVAMMIRTDEPEILRSKKSGVIAIVYIVLLVMTYKFVNKRYRKQTYRSILKEYAHGKAGLFTSYLLVVSTFLFSIVLAIALSAGIYHLVVKPLGLDGYFVI